MKKTDYMHSCAEGVYFPSFNLEPIEWLKNVREQIVESLRKKLKYDYY